jgi:hypothetical protein
MIKSDDIPDELDRIRARMRLLELALLGSDGSGMSIGGGTFRDAILQGAQDVANGLDELSEAINAKDKST